MLINLGSGASEHPLWYGTIVHLLTISRTPRLCPEVTSLNIFRQKANQLITHIIIINKKAGNNLRGRPSWFE
eukprot:scaffold2050_cov167-Amphora_coffeaeformis.AAC.10